MKATFLAIGKFGVNVQKMRKTKERITWVSYSNRTQQSIGTRNDKHWRQWTIRCHDTARFHRCEINQLFKRHKQEINLRLISVLATDNSSLLFSRKRKQSVLDWNIWCEGTGCLNTEFANARNRHRYISVDPWKEYVYQDSLKIIQLIKEIILKTN